MPNNTPDTRNLDLVFERIVDLPPEAIWRAWTTPALITQWFTPAPWETIASEIDLRPGGRFYTVMRSPEGQSFPHEGCYLAVEPCRRLVWTNALGPDFRPANTSAGGPIITAEITLTPEANGTRYHALARHATEADCQAHAAMGFEEGWGKALDQLVAVMKRQQG